MILTSEQLRNQYAGALIEVLREKGKAGEFDGDLAQRIEKLLGIDSA